MFLIPGPPVEMQQISLMSTQAPQPAYLGSAWWVSGCVTMGKCLDFSVPLSSHLQNGRC